jgi:hypothetical protein
MVELWDAVADNLLAVRAHGNGKTPGRYGHAAWRGAVAGRCVLDPDRAVVGDSAIAVDILMLAEHTASLCPCSETSQLPVSASHSLMMLLPLKLTIFFLPSHMAVVALQRGVAVAGRCIPDLDGGAPRCR